MKTEKLDNLLGFGQKVAETDAAERENANKNNSLIATRRDLLAGEVSREWVYDHLPKRVKDAVDRGWIHVHDMDYVAHGQINCSIPNFDYLLAHGFVVNGITITTPKSFEVACTVLTQLILILAGGQYGGMTVDHIPQLLAPYLEKSYKKHRAKLKEFGVEDVEEKAWALTCKSCQDGIQTINHQIYSFSANGQTPFLTFGLNTLHEDSPLLPYEVAIMREILQSRKKGIPDEFGHLSTPTFPKLIYFLRDGNNLRQSDPFFDLTQLAVDTTLCRMYPDYIFADNEEDVNGLEYCPMGAVRGDSVVTVRKNGGEPRVVTFEQFWDMLRKDYEVKRQTPGHDDFYMDVNDYSILDSHTGSPRFVPITRAIKNEGHDWVKISSTRPSRFLYATTDHPLPIVGKGRVEAQDVCVGDQLYQAMPPMCDGPHVFDSLNEAWLAGFLLRNGCLSSSSEIACTFAATGEDEIGQAIRSMFPDKQLRSKESNRENGGGNHHEMWIKDKPLLEKLKNLFGGTAKKDRTIPYRVLTSSNRLERLSFLAGIIDADGYQRNGIINLGSTNKPLALSEAILAETLGLPTSIKENFYLGHDGEKARTVVSFHSIPDLSDQIRCVKKKGHSNPATSGRPTVSHVDRVEEHWAYDVTTDSDYFDVNGIVSHNCRSFIPPFPSKEPGDEKEMTVMGGFNKGVTTINLPVIAKECESVDDFMNKLANEVLPIVREEGEYRISLLEGAKSDFDPIRWQYGGTALLKPGEDIDDYLFNLYSTTSLGYIGIDDVCEELLGEPITSKEGSKLAHWILDLFNDTRAAWNKEGYTRPGRNHGRNPNWTLYGTPAESLSGKVGDYIDEYWVTNSFHVNVTEPIRATDKLRFESQFARKSTGGNISYVEIPGDLIHNPEAVLAVLADAHDQGAIYVEFNCRLDYCDNCSFTGEIKMKDHPDPITGHWWYCPNCGNEDENKMRITRRVCGYLGSAKTTNTNAGKLEEYSHRVLHM